MNLNKIYDTCVDSLDSEQLDVLISALVEEQNKRKNEKKQLAWNKVAAVLEDYMAEYGDIKVYNEGGDTVNLSFDDFNASVIGELYERLW